MACGRFTIPCRWRFCDLPRREMDRLVVRRHRDSDSGGCTHFVSLGELSRPSRRLKARVDRLPVGLGIWPVGRVAWLRSVSNTQRNYRDTTLDQYYAATTILWRKDHSGAD